MKEMDIIPIQKENEIITKTIENVTINNTTEKDDLPKASPNNIDNDLNRLQQNLQQNLNLESKQPIIVDHSRNQQQYHQVPTQQFYQTGQSNPYYNQHPMPSNIPSHQQYHQNQLYHSQAYPVQTTYDPTGERRASESVVQRTSTEQHDQFYRRGSEMSHQYQRGPPARGHSSMRVNNPGNYIVVDKKRTLHICKHILTLVGVIQ
ncbi:hypothetical protein BC833DRAFT_574464, partial [Globomyces pollinis-pini]